MKTHQSLAVPITVVLIILITLLGTYGGCYFARGELLEVHYEGIKGELLEIGWAREFNTRSEAILFHPAVWVESMVRNADVQVRPDGRKHPQYFQHLIPPSSVSGP